MVSFVVVAYLDLNGAFLWGEILQGSPYSRKTLVIDFWVILKLGNNIRNCIAYPFDVNNHWGMFL